MELHFNSVVGIKWENLGFVEALASLIIASKVLS